MTATLRDQIWPLLRDLGIDSVFGNPGSTELTMLDGFPADLRYVLGLQEAAVVMMADGYAQVTRKPVLVNLHTGPGLGNAVGSLITAMWSRAPLVVTAGQQVRAMITEQHWLVNVDATNVPRPAVKWSFEPPRPQDVPAALARAVHTAMTPPAGPVFVSIPMDDWDAPVAEEGVADLAARQIHSLARPSTGAVDDVVAAMEAAESPVLVLGAAAVERPDAWDQVRGFVERVGIPVWAAPAAGRNVFDETSGWFRGFLPFGARQIAEKLTGHDLVLVAGAPAFTCYPYAPARFVDAGTRLVHITDDPSEAARAPLGTAVLADPALTLTELAASLKQTTRHVEPAPLPRPAPPTTGLGKPTAADVYAALARVVNPPVRVVHESPSNLAEFHRHVPVTSQGGFLTTPSGGLGYALATGVGEAIADTSRPVLVIVGDGSLHYSVSALWTATQHAAPVVVVVLANQEYAILKAFADFNKLHNGLPGLDLPGLDAVSIAAGYGVPGRRVEDATELGQLVAHALSEGRPALFEIGIDSTVPALM